MISATNRNVNDYLDHIAHCLRAGETIPHPRHRAEWQALAESFPEIAAHFADCAVQW